MGNACNISTSAKWYRDTVVYHWTRYSLRPVTHCHGPRKPLSKYSFSFPLGSDPPNRGILAHGGSVTPSQHVDVLSNLFSIQSNFTQRYGDTSRMRWEKELTATIFGLFTWILNLVHRFGYIYHRQYHIASLKLAAVSFFPNTSKGIFKDRNIFIYFFSFSWRAQRNGRS